MAKSKQDSRREVLQRTTPTTKTYYFIDDEKGINQKSREVIKKSNRIIHYPIGYNGGQRYKTVVRFIFDGFKNDSSLPIGINKSAKRGYGFTKALSPLMDVLEEKLSLKEIYFVKTGTNSLTDTRLTLSEKCLQALHPIFKNILDSQKQARLNLATSKLNQLFPQRIKAPAKTYVPNSVNAALDDWSQVIDDFSTKDKEAIKDLFNKLSLTDEFWTPETLLKTKESLDQQYIEDVIDSFKRLMAQKLETPTLEKKWQKLLATHNWVFSYLFSFPVMLFHDEAYVGGKTLSNQNGKVTDFLVKNSLTENVAFLEIKTHKTELVGSKKAYRGNDVYAMSKDLTGGINQVLDQRDNFQKEFYSQRAKSDTAFETINSKCVVLMGMSKSLNAKELKSFELFRSNSRDVDVITFDELLARFEHLQKLMNTVS